MRMLVVAWQLGAEGFIAKRGEDYGFIGVFNDWGWTPILNEMYVDSATSKYHYFPLEPPVEVSSVEEMVALGETLTAKFEADLEMSGILEDIEEELPALATYIED